MLSSDHLEFDNIRGSCLEITDFPLSISVSSGVKAAVWWLWWAGWSSWKEVWKLKHEIEKRNKGFHSLQRNSKWKHKAELSGCLWEHQTAMCKHEGLKWMPSAHVKKRGGAWTIPNLERQRQENPWCYRNNCRSWLASFQYREKAWLEQSSGEWRNICHPLVFTCTNTCVNTDALIHTHADTPRKSNDKILMLSTNLGWNFTNKTLPKYQKPTSMKSEFDIFSMYPSHRKHHLNRSEYLYLSWNKFFHCN